MRWAYINAAIGIPLRGPSGASAHVRDFVTALSSQQQVRLYSAIESDHRGVYGPKIPAITFKNNLSWIKRYREIQEISIARKISNKIVSDSWTPEILLERHSLFSDASWRVSKRLGIPWVLEVNAPIFEERLQYEHLRFPRLAKTWQRDVLRACPAIFAVSKWLQRWLVEEVGCKNVHWLPNGSSEKVGNPERGRAILGVTSSKPIIGFVGSLRSWQGAHRIPSIARRLEAVSVCIGQGQSIGTDIQFPIYDEQKLADVISSFSVAVAPYTAQAPPWLCPLKLLQYRAQGVPIVSSDVGDAAWIVEQSGSVVPADDDNHLIAAIEYWMRLSGHKKLRSWGQVSRELISYVHEWAKTGYRI
jgi:glycosyltransferase involved in cell wall biosynthesis